MHPVFVFAWVALSASSVLAQDASRDRAELDDAAGRAVFQPTSIYESVQPPTARSVGSAAPEPRPGEAGRRTVRIVYPGPIGPSRSTP